MNRSKVIVLLVFTIAILLIMVGISYAYFTAVASSNDQVVEVGTLKLTYHTGQNISLDSIFAGEEIDAAIHTFAIENTGTMPATYYLYLDNILLQKDGVDTQSKNLKWKLYRASSDYTQQEEISSGSFKDGNNPLELDTEIQINPTEKHYYVFKIWLQETGESQNEGQRLDFSGIIEATTVKKAISRELVDLIKDEAVMDNVASTYVTSSTGIDFSQISSDTNGKGLYILHGTENDQYPIMYYRGAVENNHVKFANFCWRIVRTTESGGVKLIYNGIPDSNGQCRATDDSVGTMISVFNTHYGDNTFVGYMYGTAYSNNYAVTHANTNNSDMKTAIDKWYSENMTDYTDQLEDTIWCNDRSLSSGSGTGSSITYYSAYDRLVSNKIPTLECINENDRFTVNEENGNGALTYPVALLTADEIAYAGAVASIDNTTFYLNYNFSLWSLSPFYFSGSHAHMFLMTVSGALGNHHVPGSTYVRPAISLKNGIRVIDGNGTLENPYIVE